MTSLLKCAMKAIIIVFIGGLMGATLVRFAPGNGVTEEELDSRLNADSLRALRLSHESPRNLMSFYVQYGGKIAHGDLGFSTAMHEPVRQLVAERFPETMRSVGFGVGLGWGVGLSLAILSVGARSGKVDFGISLVATIALCTPAAVL